MQKYLVTLELRYNDVPNSKYSFSGYVSKTIAIGVFDSEEEAVKEGNSKLEILEKHFKLNPHWNVKDRLVVKKKNLVTNLGYLQTPFEFYMKMIELYYLDIETSILEAVEGKKRYSEYLRKENE